MLARSKNKLAMDVADDEHTMNNHDSAVNLKWSYNYFSIDSDESFPDWRDRFPLSLKDALYEEEQ